MPAYHALLAPSSAHRWTDCTASIQAAFGKPNESSEAARVGTCGHQMGAECLIDGWPADSYLGRVMGFPKGGRNEDWIDCFPAGVQFEYTVVVDQALCDAVQAYVDYVNQLVASTGGELFVEQRVPIGHITGEGAYWALPDDLATPVPEGSAGAVWVETAGGTSDAAIVAGDTFYSIDLKLGRSKVHAYDVISPAGTDILSGEPTPPVLRMNLQLALYALGGLEKHKLYDRIKHVKAIIVQPFLKQGSEYACSIEDLLAISKWLSKKADETRNNPTFSPSADNCFFCRARRPGDCKARDALVMEKTIEGFDDVTTATVKAIELPKLGSLYKLKPLVMQWVKLVEETVRKELEEGRDVIDDEGNKLKLVPTEGDRAWASVEEVEATMRKMRIKDEVIFKRTVISPAQAEKLAKVKRAKKGQEAEVPPIGPTQWKRLQEMIVRPAGRPEIVGEDDPRPAWRPAVEGFDEVPAEDNSDLF